MEKNNKQKGKAEEVAVTEDVIAVDNKSSKAALIWIAIVVLLCLLAGATWFLQQQFQKQQREMSNLRQQLSASEQLGKQVSKLMLNLEKEAASTQQGLADLNTADIALTAKLDTLGESQQLTSNDVLHTWALAEVNFLLKTANHSVLLAGDVEKAQTALSLADQQLESLYDPRLHELRALLSDEQLALNSVKKVDETGLAVQLQSALKNVSHLQVLMGPAITTVADDDAAAVSSLPESLQSAATSAWQEIKSLVVIRHQEDANAALLVPEQRYFLYQNLQLKIESAHLALLSGKEKVFHDSLASATQWLQQYFVGEERDAMLEMLQAMQQQTIKVELPDISASLIWLQQYGDQ